MAELKQKKRSGDEDQGGTGPLQSPLKQKETEKEQETTKKTERSVFCTHGVHSGSYPVGGMTVSEAREFLSGILNIPKDAVCAIGGEVVGEKTVIGENVDMMAFIKQASVKGFAEVLTISGKRLQGDGFGMAIAAVSDAMAENAIKGVREEPFPSGCLWRIDAGDASVLILQLEPALRLMKIAANEGSSAKNYQDMRLATPFVILKVPLKGGVVQNTAELFYRNEPARSIDDELFWSNLLNVSPNSYGVLAWVCTQFLWNVLKDKSFGYKPVDKGKYREIDQVDALVKHIFDGGFNRSSEGHEGASCFSKACDRLKDGRVTDFARWQTESVKDPTFMTTVKWEPTGITIRQLIDKTLKQLQAPGVIQDTAMLRASLMGFAARHGIKISASGAEKL